MQARLIANSISTSSPLPGAGPPRGSGHSVVLPVASLSPYLSKKCLVRTKDGPVTEAISRGFGALCQRLRDEAKYISHATATALCPYREIPITATL